MIPRRGEIWGHRSDWQFFLGGIIGYYSPFSHKLHFSAPLALLCAVILYVKCAHLSIHFPAAAGLRKRCLPTTPVAAQSRARPNGADRTQRAVSVPTMCCQRWCENGGVPDSGHSTQPNPCCGLGQHVRIPTTGFLLRGAVVLGLPGENVSRVWL